MDNLTNDVEGAAGRFLIPRLSAHAAARTSGEHLSGRAVQRQDPPSPASIPLSEFWERIDP